MGIQWLRTEHGRARRALLSGDDGPTLRMHLDSCASCSSLASRLAIVDRLAPGVLEPRPELLQAILRRTERPPDERREEPIELRPRRGPSGAWALTARPLAIAVMIVIVGVCSYGAGTTTSRARPAPALEPCYETIVCAG